MTKKKQESQKHQDDASERNLDEIVGALLKVPPKKKESSDPSKNGNSDKK